VTAYGQEIRTAICAECAVTIFRVKQARKIICVNSMTLKKKTVRSPRNVGHDSPNDKCHIAEDCTFSRVAVRQSDLTLKADLVQA
jgi:hypothetical protein